MKSTEISELRCCKCDKQPLQKLFPGDPEGEPAMFYRINVVLFRADVHACQQVYGLNHIFLGKSLALAEVFSPDPEVAKIQGEPTTVYLCKPCALMAGDALELGKILEEHAERCL